MEKAVLRAQVFSAFRFCRAAVKADRPLPIGKNTPDTCVIIIMK